MEKEHYADITPAEVTVSATARSDQTVLARSDNALVLKEVYKGKALAPVYYLPVDDVDTGRLVKNTEHRTHCPIKGDASYYSLKTEQGEVENIAWSYENPVDEAAGIKDHLAFDGRLVDVRAGVP